MKWICCQIGAREHYAVARALDRQNALHALVTDAWVRPGNLLGKLKPSIRSRFHRDLANADIYASNFASLSFELRAKLAGLRGWPKVVARNAWFQRFVVEKLSGINFTAGTPTVMAYSYAALEVFKFARARGWRTVLGQIDPGPPEERIVAALYEKSPAHTGEFVRPRPEYWANWREECELADRIVVNSAWSLAALVSEGLPAAKIKIVPLAYEEARAASVFRREYPLEFSASRPLRVLFLGQINLRKGIEPLVDAIRRLRREPIEFLLVGPIQVSIPSDLRDDPRVHLFGPLPHEAAGQFYQQADLFLFPTFSDGFGLTQLEAQAWQLPIVATRFCGDVVEENRNGWILPEVSGDAIAAIIRKCLACPACLKKLSGNSTAAKRFDLSNVGEQWLNVFQ
jgi:glycosyltransferase involved in cell wall biosynthesis